MVITKSNKHKLLLDHDKPNEKGWMHTCYSPCTNKAIILDSQISITSVGSFSPLHSQGCFIAEQMGKRPPLDEWSKYLYPLIQNITFGS